MADDLTPKQIRDFDSNGVIKVPAAISPAWVDRLLTVVDKQLQHPSQWANDGNQGARENRMFTDRYQWKVNSEIEAYIRLTSVAKLAAQAMQSLTARFYFDHMIVKEPNTASPTPWHQDIPYWPFWGKKICSTWVSLTQTTVAESAMEFVAGSHKNGNYYKPEAFIDGEDNPNAKWQKGGTGAAIPKIETSREEFNIVGWDVEPGDAIMFSA